MQNADPFDLTPHANELDPTVDEIPEGHQIVAYVIYLTPVPGQPRQRRVLDPLDIGPADERLAEACNGGNPISVNVALEKSGTLGLMVLWVVAGRQMGLKKESPRYIESWFTMRALERGDVEARVIVEPDRHADQVEGDGADPS